MVENPGGINWTDGTPAYNNFSNITWLSDDM